jgi:hypothetical protein
MADPISITGLVLAIPPIVRLLVAYGSGIKNAKSDIQRYISELLSLKGILEHIGMLREGNTLHCRYDEKEFWNIVHTTSENIAALHEIIEPKRPGFGSAMQRMTWTLKKEIDQEIARLERAKTWFILLMTSDNYSSGKEILSEISWLSSSIREDRAEIAHKSEAKDI